MTNDYNAADDGHKSYLAAIEAKRLRGDHKIDAIERNLFALERLVHDLQKDIQDIKKGLRND